MELKLIDIAYLIECTQTLFCAIEYECDTPFHYTEYKEIWEDYGYELKEEDSKMIDEGTEIIQSLLSKNQAIINEAMSNKKI